MVMPSIPRPSHPLRARAAAILAVLCALALAAPLAPAQAATAAARANSRAGEVVPGSYIVTLADDASLERVARAHFIPPQAMTETYHSAFLGFTANLPASAVSRLAEDARVESVEPNRWIDVAGTQTAPPWGLDRTDQRTRPLSNTYEYGTTGAGVDTYILDTGVRSSHVDLAGRVARGFDATGFGTTEDCNGHGTHVAATAAGSTYGIAKGATVIPVRVMYCDGAGTASDILEGLDWVAEHHQTGEPAVANMSLASDQPISAIDTAIRAGIADGITYVVAAGNAAVDACGISPANVVEAITVGASDERDEMAFFSNHGPCLDLFAPGTNVRSAGNLFDTDEDTLSGTSMAAPHVAGVAARYLQSDPAATPAQVAFALTTSATPDAVSQTTAGSPTSLLYAAPPSSTVAWKAATPPASSLSKPSTSRGALTYGSSVSVTGRMTSGGAGVAFEVVKVQAQRAGSSTWRNVAARTTDSDGRVQYTASPAASTRYRLRYVGDTYSDSTSEVSRLVGVRTRVGATLSDGTVRRGTAASLAGRVRPSHAGKAVDLQRYASGAWRTIKSKRLDSRSRYTFTLNTATRGTYRYRVVRAAETDHLRGVSPRRVLTVE